MTAGTKVLLYGSKPATVFKVSSSGKSVYVVKADGRASWTSSTNVRAVA